MTKGTFEWLTEDSVNFLKNGYLIEGKEPKERIRDIADEAERVLGVEGFSDKFYEYMSKGYYSLSSPVWSNYGTDRGLPISCFGSNIEDTMGSILYAQSEVGIMSKFGGGTSGYFGNIRPRGASITDNGKSSGAVHFMKLFETMVDVTSQGSTRRGSFAPYLPSSHDDVSEFLDIGTEGHPIQGLTHGLTLTDEWMNNMIEGDEEKRVIWAKLLQRRVEMGYPFMMFKDTVNKEAVDVYVDEELDVDQSNLCVPYETKILTDCGYEEIGSKVGEKVNIWNGEEWSNVEILKTAEDQELVRIVTDSGYELDSTPYHKYFILEDTSNGGRTNPPRYKEVRANELKKGDKLIKFDLPVIEGYKTLNGAYDIAYVDINNKKSVPVKEYKVKNRLQWLAGFLDRTGYVTRVGKYHAIEAKTTNKDYLKEVQLLLQTLGVNGKVSTVFNMQGEYVYYSLFIDSESLFKLRNIGFNTLRLEWWNLKSPNKEDEKYMRVVDVFPLEERKDTFCFTEPKRHMGMFNGLLTGQCSEITLPNGEDESFVCCLSSMNLLHYDEWKDTDAVETLTYFLDAVMTEFIVKLEKMRDSGEAEEVLAFQFMERTYNFAKRHRALGLGALGWHSYLQSKMIPFEDLEASKLNAWIFRDIQERALKASEELALLFGEPEVLKGYGRRNTTLTAVAP